ncbi:MAG TPA: peptidylprolyl isomerase [Caulobacteraceae bacterium]
MDGIARRRLIGAAGLLALGPRMAWAAVAAKPGQKAGPKPGAKPRVAIETSQGTIVVELEDRKAPITSANFLRYADTLKYNGGSFYRASRTVGAGPGHGSIQAGPSPYARHFPPIAHESTTKTGLRHKAGTISLTRNEPGTATSDFFICASDQPYLDAHPGESGDNQGFAAFGHVVSGMDVVKKILAMHTGKTAPVPAMKGQMLDPPVPIMTIKRV